MAAKKAPKAAPKATPKEPTTEATGTGGPRSTSRLGDGEQQVAGDQGTGPEPHEVNDMLASDRMQALLADMRANGSRPG